MYNDAELDPTFVRRFAAGVAVWLPVTAGLALLGSVLHLLLYSWFPRTTVVVMALGSLLAGVGMSALCFTTGALIGGFVLAGCTALAAVVFLLLLALRRRAHAVAELLMCAAHCTWRNPQLLIAALIIQLVGLLVLSYGFAGFFSAINSGYVSRNWDATQRFAAAEENGFCLNAHKQRIPCCVYRNHAWAYAYSVAAAAFVLWSAILVLQVRTFTAADTLAQWYFAATLPPALADLTTPGTGMRTDSGLGLEVGAGVRPASLAFGVSGGGLSAAARASVRSALRHGLAASFGSLAAAAVVLAPMRAVRCGSQALLQLPFMERAAGCVLQPLAAATERFTAFTVVVAAVTGRAFLPAARAAVQMLQRNLLSPYGVWWAPDTLLRASAALLSLAWAAVVFFATFSANQEFKPVVLPVSFATAGASFLLMLYCLLFTTGLPLDAVQTLYICYAIDRDQRRVTRPNVHAVIETLPLQSVQLHGGAPEPESGSAAQRSAQAPPPWSMSPPAAAPSVALALVAAETAVSPAFSGAVAAETDSPRAGTPGSAPSRLKRRAL